MSNYSLFDDKPRKMEPKKQMTPPPEWLKPFFSPMAGLSIIELQEISRALGNGPIKGKKDALIDAVLKFLTFDNDQKKFDTWFKKLPDYLQTALDQGAFDDFLFTGDLEKKYKIKIIETISRYGMKEFELIKGLRLEMFEPLTSIHIRLKSPLRKLFQHWLPMPTGYTLRPCAPPEASPWSNMPALTESLPLLMDALKDLPGFTGKDAVLYKLKDSRLKKGEIRSIRSRCAQEEFPRAGKFGLDPIEIWYRVLVALNKKPCPRNEDIRDYIKQTLTDFFNPVLPGKARRSTGPAGGLYEFVVLASYLSKRQGSTADFDALSPTPPSREIFKSCLDIMAKSGEWYSPSDICRSIQMQALPFFLTYFQIRPDDLRLKGNNLDYRNFKFGPLHYLSYFVPLGILHQPLVVEPLVKGYCYLMAAMGILEIIEDEPPQPLTVDKKTKPVSPYDGLTHIRITPLGRWCLGQEPEKPALKALKYEAIADNHLLIVTFKGISLECKLFLEEIGNPLGRERFRISPESFIKNCQSVQDIEKRIERFTRLICSEPSVRWQNFFADIRQKSTVLDTAEPCLLFRLPGDPAVRKLFLEDPRLAKLAHRTQGGNVVVPENNIKKFRKVMEEFGFLNIL